VIDKAELERLAEQWKHRASQWECGGTRAQILEFVADLYALAERLPTEKEVMTNAPEIGRPVAPPPSDVGGGEKPNIPAAECSKSGETLTRVPLPEPDMPVYDLRGTPVHAHSTDQLLAHREEYAAARVASVSRQWAEAIERSADDCAVLRQRAETADRERDEARAEAERMRRDAGRYRWIRDRANFGEAFDLISRKGPNVWDETIDAAILADRRGEP
jgi:hypothetical protein